MKEFTLRLRIVQIVRRAEAVTPPWAEIATDGFVVFERNRQVSLLLAQIRSRIAFGDLVRRVVHGQPYGREVP